MTSPPPRAVPAAPSPEGSTGRFGSGRVVSGFRRRARERVDVARSAADARWGRPRDTHRPVYLVAPAGHPNHGDEQLLAGWLRHLRHRLPGTPVVVDCHTPGQAAVLHHGEHPDVLFTDTVWRLAGECPDAAGAIGFTRRAVRDLGVRPAVASGVDLLRSASVVHLIGGGYVNDLWPHHLGVAAAAGEVGRLTGARVVATGQGLVPCGDVGPLADAFSGFDLVAVRDETSLDLLADTEVPVRLVGDDGWLALSEEGGLESVRHPVYSTDPDTCRDLVVCAQADLAEPAEFADAVARVLADWGVPGERMTVIESIPGGDRVVWDMVCERAAAATSAATATSAAATSAATATSATTTPATIPATEGDDDDEVGVALAGLDLPRARFVPFQELWSAGLPARPGQVWLSTRFHPHLFAAARGASGVALRTGSAYYDVKHRSLRAAGSAWTAVAAGDGHVPDVPTAGGFDPAVVSGRVGDAEALAGEIYPLR